MSFIDWEQLMLIYLYFTGHITWIGLLLLSPYTYISVATIVAVIIDFIKKRIRQKKARQANK